MVCTSAQHSHDMQIMDIILGVHKIKFVGFFVLYHLSFSPNWFHFYFMFCNLYPIFQSQLISQSFYAIVSCHFILAGIMFILFCPKHITGTLSCEVHYARIIGMVCCDLHVIDIIVSQLNILLKDFSTYPE